MPKTLEEFTQILNKRCGVSMETIDQIPSERMKALLDHFDYYVNTYGENYAVRFFTPNDERSYLEENT